MRPRRRPADNAIASVVKIVTGSASILLLLFFWWLAAELQWVNTLLLPSPIRVAESGWGLLVSGTLLEDAAVSLGRVFAGFAVAVAIAIPIAGLMGSFRPMYRFFDPLIEAFRPIPPIAMIPLAILWFGIGEASKLSVVAYAAFFPIALNAIAGFKAVDETHLRAARVLGAGRFAEFWHVRLPTAVPYLAVGLRLGMGMAFLSLVAAELIAASSGLGQLIQDARAQFRTDRVLVGIVTIAILGFSLNKALSVAEARLVRWR